MRLFKKLFSFFWDRSLLIFLIIGGLNTLVSMVGSQLLYGALGYWGATVHRMQRVQLYLQPEIQF